MGLKKSRNTYQFDSVWRHNFPTSHRRREVARQESAIRIVSNCPGRAKGRSWSPGRPGQRYRRERGRIVWTLYFCYGKVDLRMCAACVSLCLFSRDHYFHDYSLAIRNCGKIERESRAIAIESKRNCISSISSILDTKY